MLGCQSEDSLPICQSEDSLPILTQSHWIPLLQKKMWSIGSRPCKPSGLSPWRAVLGEPFDNWEVPFLHQKCNIGWKILFWFAVKNRLSGMFFSAFWPIEQRYLLLKFEKIHCQLGSSLVNPVSQTTEDILIYFDWRGWDLTLAPTFGVFEQEFDGNHKNFVWVVFTSVKQFFSTGFMGCLTWTWLCLLRSRPAHNVSFIELFENLIPQSLC